MKATNIKENIIIIGGGPVGLWTAILIKANLEQKNVIVLEKRTTYVREHLLKLEKSSFDFKHIEKNNKFYNDINIFQNSIPKKIKTNKLEENLTNLAKLVGVEIRNGVIISNLLNLYEIFKKD